MVEIYNKILFCTDGSPHSDIVAKQIGELQKYWNCQIVVFHSLKDNKYISRFNSDNSSLCLGYENKEGLRRELGKEILKQTKKIFDILNISVGYRLIEDETPEDYIKRMIREEEFDLVILGNNGHCYKSHKSFLPPRFTKILKHYPCDVLIFG